MEAELKRVHKFNLTLTANYQQLVGSLRQRDTIVQGQMDCLEARLGHHRRDIEGHQRDIDQLSEDQVTLVTRMTGYEDEACNCGAGSDRLSDLSYQEPMVAEVSETSFPGGVSSVPIPIPPPLPSVQAQDVAVPSSSSSSSGSGPSVRATLPSSSQRVNDFLLESNQSLLVTADRLS